jgi:hypothetical protein
MRPVRAVTVAASALMIAISGLAGSARGEPEANAVTDWNRIAVTTLTAIPGPAGGAPPASQINMAMTQGAVFDAVNAIQPQRYVPFLLTRRFSAAASVDAAVGTAAFRVLTNIVSTVPPAIPFPNQASLLQTLETSYSSTLAEIPDSAAKKQGIRAGNAAADAMIAARQADGRFGPSQWVPNRDPGHWWPLSAPDGTPILDPTPWVGGVTPFVMTSSSQFRTAGPNPLTGAAWATEFNEVKTMGAVNSAVRTPEQTHIAIFWQSTPVATWNSVARTIVEDPSRGVSLAEAARLFAMENVAAADAAINCWNDKYHFDFWRPWNAIPRADEDGNPATEPDPTWAPLIAAPYPEHPSGHLCLDGAHLRVLSTFFGTDEIGFDVGSAQFPGETRHFDRFSRALAEITEARIWAGLHYRNADLQAQLLGRNVADYVDAHSFRPVR